MSTKKKSTPFFCLFQKIEPDFILQDLVLDRQQISPSALLAQLHQAAPVILGLDVLALRALPVPHHTDHDNLVHVVFKRTDQYPPVFFEIYVAIRADCKRPFVFNFNFYSFRVFFGWEKVCTANFDILQVAGFFHDEVEQVFGVVVARCPFPGW